LSPDELQGQDWPEYPHFFLFILVFMLLGMEPGPLQMLGK
jgi:hypothetical protein